MVNTDQKNTMKQNKDTKKIDLFYDVNDQQFLGVYLQFIMFKRKEKKNDPIFCSFTFHTSLYKLTCVNIWHEMNFSELKTSER